jgi:hypothetical protein
MLVLKAAGEYPSMNELTAPQGAALRAVNVVVDVSGEYATHRGMERSANGSRVWSSLTYYAGSIIAHSEADGVLARLTAGVWTEYSGTYNAPAGERMAFQESNGALFLTTSEGLLRLDGPTATPVPSGLAQGLPGTAALTGSSGYLTEGFTVAYRHSWAHNVDAQGNARLVEGAPSPRLLVNNPTATAASRDVVVSWPIPDGLPAGAFIRTFRSDAVVETISPTDEVRQVYERAPTDTERTARVFTFTDSTPDAVKGAGAYFSANTGAGLAQSNYAAPLVHGLAAFNDSVFGVTVDGVQRLTLNILGVGGDGLQTGQILEINTVDDLISENYFGAGSESFPFQFQLFTGGTPAQNLARTVDSLCRAINSNSSGAFYAVSLDSDGTNPGGLVLQRRTLDQTQFTIYTDGNGQAFAPALREKCSDLVSIARAANVVTVEFASDHPFTLDDDVELVYSGAADPDFPAGVKTISGTPTSTTITYAEMGADAAPSPLVYAYLFQSGDAPESTSGTAANAYAWAKQGEPDHYPLANLGTVGNAADTLWWGQPLDRFLFLGSSSGLYRLTGNANEGFYLMDGGVWDSTVSFLGRRNVAALDGQAYAIAREGLVTWSEGQKPESVDIPIQEEIRSLVAAIPDTVAELGFMVADETNHRLYVCLPESADAVAATRCHLYSSRTGAWTRLTGTFPGFEEGWVGAVAPKGVASGQLHVLTPEGSPQEGRVLSTRVTYTNADYQGPAGEAVPSKVTYLPLLAGEPGRKKNWTWARIFTKDPTTKLQVCFATERKPAEECQLLPDVDPVYTGYEPVTDPVRGIAWRTHVDRFNTEAQGLTVSVGHSIPQEPLHLLGIEVKHRTYGGGQ